jgi:penicillin-binding protein 1A
MPRSKWVEEQRKNRFKSILKFKVPRKKYARIIVILLLFTVAMATAGFYSIAKDLPGVADLPERLSYTSFIYNGDGSVLIATLNSVENRMNVNFETMPDYLKQAFVATEDERFYRHFGVDIRATLRAVRANISARAMVQGGSTITQQLAKNVYLGHEKTILRKMQEWVLAARIERHYSKDRILEMYLNQLFLGYNAYGVESASVLYFGKSASHLSLAESAMLAGIAKAPNALSPRDHFEQAKARQAIVLSLMAKNEYITEAEAEVAKNEEIVIAPIESTKYQCPYFVDYVLKDLLATFGAELVYSGGLSVYTTIDPVTQKEAEVAIAEILGKAFPPKRNDPGPEVALISMDPNNGYIKAMVGGRTHESVMCLNRTQQPRQPGSAFKPVAVFAPAIAKGYSPESVIEDAPITLAVGKATWSPRNYNNRYLGRVSLREAAARSINTVAVRLIDAIGVGNSLASIQNLGITTLELENPRINDKGPAIALGGLTRGVTPMELNSAYGVFATGGYLAQPVAILKVVDRSGKVLYERKPNTRSVLDPGVAYLVTDMLKDTISKSYGTAARNGNIGRPAAAKTGTSSNIRDAWFVGYTPNLVTTVWMGYDKGKNMSDVYGGGYPALIWNRVMRVGHRHIPKQDFAIPGNLIRTKICSVSGLLPGSQCSSGTIVNGWFIAGKQPRRSCNVCFSKPLVAGSNYYGSNESGYVQPGTAIGEPYDPNQYYNPVMPKEPDPPADSPPPVVEKPPPVVETPPPDEETPPSDD